MLLRPLISFFKGNLNFLFNHISTSDCHKSPLFEMFVWLLGSWLSFYHKEYRHPNWRRGDDAIWVRGGRTSQKRFN